MTAHMSTRDAAELVAAAPGVAGMLVAAKRARVRELVEMYAAIALTDDLGPDEKATELKRLTQRIVERNRELDHLDWARTVVG